MKKKIFAFISIFTFLFTMTFPVNLNFTRAADTNEAIYQNRVITKGKNKHVNVLTYAALNKDIQAGDRSVIHVEGALYISSARYKHDIKGTNNPLQGATQVDTAVDISTSGRKSINTDYELCSAAASQPNVCSNSNMVGAQAQIDILDDGTFILMLLNGVALKDLTFYYMPSKVGILFESITDKTKIKAEARSFYDWAKAPSDGGVGRKVSISTPFISTNNVEKSAVIWNDSVWNKQLTLLTSEGTGVNKKRIYQGNVFDLMDSIDRSNLESGAYMLPVLTAYKAYDDNDFDENFKSENPQYEKMVKVKTTTEYSAGKALIEDAKVTFTRELRNGSNRSSYSLFVNKDSSDRIPTTATNAALENFAALVVDDRSSSETANSLYDEFEKTVKPVIIAVVAVMYAVVSISQIVIIVRSSDEPETRSAAIKRLIAMTISIAIIELILIFMNPIRLALGKIFGWS